MASMTDIAEIMVVSANGTSHENVVHELSNYDEEDDSSEIIARIPNYNSESKEGNGNSMKSNEFFADEVEESNSLDAFKELQVKDTGLSAQPKSQNTTGKSLGLKNDMKNNGNDAKRTLIRSGLVASDVRLKQSVAVEKKSGNSRPAINQVKAHLPKQPGKSDSLTSTANVVQSEGIKETNKVKSMKTVHRSTTEGRTHSSESSTTGDEKPQRLGTLPAYGYSFRCNERAEKRKEFYSKLEEKIHAKEEERSTLQAKTKENQEAEIKMLRKSLMFKATPMPSFYREAPPKTELKKIPTTRAKSPKLGRKKDSPTGEEMEANGGNTFRPPRLSLDEKKSLNNKPAKGLSPVHMKKPTRKSLPKLPSEKTKLSKDTKEVPPPEITISSKETDELETQPNKDSSHAEAESPTGNFEEKAKFLAN